MELKLLGKDCYNSMYADTCFILNWPVGSWLLVCALVFHYSYIYNKIRHLIPVLIPEGCLVQFLIAGPLWNQRLGCPSPVFACCTALGTSTLGHVSSGCCFWRSFLSPFCCDEDQDPSRLLLLCSCCWSQRSVNRLDKRVTCSTCDVSSSWEPLRWTSDPQLFPVFALGVFFWRPPPPAPVVASFLAAAVTSSCKDLKKKSLDLLVWQSIQQSVVTAASEGFWTRVLTCVCGESNLSICSCCSLLQKDFEEESWV